MTVTDPISPAFALADSVLTADSTFMGYVQGVYQQMAPAIAYTKPFCILQMQSPPIDTNDGMGIRVLSRGILTCKIVGKAGPDGAAMRNAFARADALLNPNGHPRRIGDNNSGSLLYLFRDGTLEYPELVDGTLWLHLGGQYRYAI